MADRWLIEHSKHSVANFLGPTVSAIALGIIILILHFFAKKAKREMDSTALQKLETQQYENRRFALFILLQLPVLLLTMNLLNRWLGISEYVVGALGFFIVLLIAAKLSERSSKKKLKQ